MALDARAQEAVQAMLKRMVGWGRTNPEVLFRGRSPAPVVSVPPASEPVAAEEVERG